MCLSQLNKSKYLNVYTFGTFIRAELCSSNRTEDGVTLIILHTDTHTPHGERGAYPFHCILLCDYDEKGGGRLFTLGLRLLLYLYWDSGTQVDHVE